MATKRAAMFCMFLVIVQTREDMVLTRRVNEPENSLLDMLRRKLILNNVDYDEASTDPTTTSPPLTPSTITSPPSTPSTLPICVMPINNQQNRDIYNPYNNPYKSNNHRPDNNYLLRQGNAQPRSSHYLYNPYHHPHYKPLHNPGYAPFHRAPYIVYGNPDHSPNEPSESPIYLRADVPINQVGQTVILHGQNFPQISEFEPDIPQDPSHNIQPSLDSQNPSPAFLEYPIHLQAESPQQVSHEVYQSVKHAPAQLNPQHTQNFSLTYRLPHPTPRDIPKPLYRPPHLYVPVKPYHRPPRQPSYQVASQLENRFHPLSLQQKKPEFRAYRFIPTSRVTSTASVITFPTNSLKPIKKSDEKVHQLKLKPNTLIPEKRHEIFEVILNSNATTPQSESMEAWTAEGRAKTFKGFKLAPGVTSIGMSSESRQVNRNRQIGEKKKTVDLDELLNQVMKRAAKLRSTPEPLSFQKYQNQSFAARRSGNYLKWQLSHVIPQSLQFDKALN